jgi:hypothetical protein
MARPSSPVRRHGCSPQLPPRALAARIATAEWRFAFESAFWGAGGIREGAQVVVDFDIDSIDGQVLEAPRSVQHTKRTGVWRGIAAVHAATVTDSRVRNGQYIDQMLWSIVDTNSLQAKAVWGPKVH